MLLKLGYLIHRLFTKKINQEKYPSTDVGSMIRYGKENLIPCDSLPRIQPLVYTSTWLNTHTTGLHCSYRIVAAKNYQKKENQPCALTKFDQTRIFNKEQGMKRTHLFYHHLKNQAQFVYYNGVILPAWFDSVDGEYTHIQTQTFFFELGSLVNFLITGEDRDRLANRLFTQDIIQIEPNELRKALVLHEDGRIFESTGISRLGDGIMFSVRSINKKAMEQLLQKNPFELAYHYVDLSETTGRIAVCGSQSRPLIEGIVNASLGDLATGMFDLFAFKGNEVLISPYSMYGFQGYELYYDGECGELLWQELQKNGVEYQAKPIGLLAGEIVRVERGIPSFTREIRGRFIKEVGYEERVNFSKENFYGKDGAKESMVSPTTHRLYFLKIQGKPFPKPYAQISNMYHESLGTLSSCIYSPKLNGLIGMAFLEQDKLEEQSSVIIGSESPTSRATVSLTPFAE